MNAVSTFDARGYALVERVLDAALCETLARAVARGGEGRAGSRNLLGIADCRELAQRLQDLPAITPLLPACPVAAQCTLFDKSDAHNWLAALHQDLGIPVRARVADPQCTGWSEKEGVLFVQPPPAFVASLTAVRVHLDDCGPGAGPLRVVPGSHRHGRLTASEARRLRQLHGEVECVARRGDALVLRPLLLHASSKVTAPSRRRVLHFLFGPAELPCGLQWPSAHSEPRTGRGTVA